MLFSRLSKIYSSESSISSKKSINEKKEKIYTEDDENLLWGPEDRYVELCTQISEIYVTDKKLSKLGKGKLYVEWLSEFFHHIFSNFL